MRLARAALCAVFVSLAIGTGCQRTTPDAERVDEKPTAAATDDRHEQPLHDDEHGRDTDANHEHADQGPGAHAHNDEHADHAHEAGAEAVEIEPVATLSAPARLDDRTVVDLLDEVLAAADEGQTSVTLVQHLAGRGLAAALAAGERWDAEHPGRTAVLCDVIAQAGRGRRWDAHLLEQYDPAGWALFYGEDAAARQQALGRLLTADKWPRELPAAMLAAAPLPTLDWLHAQAQSEQPDGDKLRRLCRQWGQWVRQNNERQYAPEFTSVLVDLLAHPALAADPAVQADLLRAAGDCRAVACLAALRAGLDSEHDGVRRSAGAALGRLKTETARDALAAAANLASDPALLAEVAAALGNWPDDEAAGAAVQKLFERSTDDTVRHAALYSAVAARWPQRTAILQAAFQSPGEGNLGIALLALTAEVPAELRDAVLQLAQELTSAQPGVVDALGALGDERGVTYLRECLEHDASGPLRMKAAFALEKIPALTARAALLAALERETDPAVMEHLVGIAGNLKLAAAGPLLAGLAADTTAPMSLRVQAIWALGALPTPDAQAAIADLSRDPRAAFGRADDPALSAGDAERIELASLYLALARLRQGSPTAAADVEQLYHDGAATTQLSALLLLGRLRIDHPVIAVGLESDELAVLLSAVRAAGAAAPQKYHDQLVALRDSPWINRLLTSSADALSLERDLQAAIAAGQEGSR